MRLHQLTLTAFGPFAGTEQVDFDRLADSGLFLLRGATGAGKSSVLDAVCYALYGEVPGARKGNPLRSDHAEPGRLTEVRLEVTLGGRRLEVTRSPEQLRPKKRGDGFTPEKAQTLLREWVADTGAGEPGWQPLSRSHQEAGEELHRLIGMSREQFCQVVLLPQGDFARFLRADTKQRAELLGKLFDTRRFDQLERWLADQRLREEAAVREGRLQLRDLAGRAEEAAGAAAEEAAGYRPEEDAPAEDVLGWAAMLRGGAAERLAVARSAVARAEAAHTEARAERAAAAALAERQARYRAAVAEAERQAAAGEALAGEQARLTAAQAAVGVEAVLRLRAAAAEAHRAATRTEASRRTALAAAEAATPGGVPGDRTGGAPGGPAGGPLSNGPGGSSSSDPASSASSSAGGSPGGVPGPAGLAGSGPLAAAGGEQLAAAERRLRAEVGRLEAARADESRYQRLGAEQAEAAAERQRVEEFAEEAQDWLVEFDGRLKALTEEQEAARAAHALTEQLDGRRADLAARLAAAVRRDELRGRVAEAERAVSGLRGAALDARARALDLRESRLAGMAAELAGRLVPGEACRVCGSAEHPAPAVPVGAPVTAEDEERAREVQRVAEERLGAAESALTALRVEEASASGSAGDRSVAELTDGLAAVDRERRAALRAADGLGAIGRRIDRLTAERLDRQERVRRAGEDSARLTAKLQALAAERQDLAARISAARGDAPSVAARAAALDALAGAVAATLAAVHASAEATARLAGAEHEVAAAATAAGFRSAAEAEAAVLPAERRAALAERLERVRSALARAEALLADPQLVAAAARPAADPAGALAAEELATDRLRRASSAERTAAERCEALARIGGRLARFAAELAPTLDRYGRISRLAGLLAGAPSENLLRMRLESYVLAARLEQVAAAASDRLVKMSGGRYTLVHSDELVSGNKRSGLSLRVVDAWTGSERDTATLSGGESFFASLALALGLADVVTDEAGGMPLDTLFIDEGFGSLDEHTLEEVMDVLDGLRERDRTVGIVSHVADLRSRIPAQLLVRKHRHGSTLRLAAREDA